MNKAALILGVLVMSLLGACQTHKSTAENSTPSKPAYASTRDGHYRVRKGDSLHAIAFKYGLDWRDIASLNNIPAPYLIYPDQQLRLPAATQDLASSASKSGKTDTQAKTTPAQSSTGSAATRRPDTTTTTAIKTPQASTTTQPGSQAATTTPSQAPASTGKSSSTGWQWPTSGRILSNFKANDPARNGVDIAGEEGQSIVASAAGEVVYSGNGLISYGELIIIKHNDRMLSAYAHNRTRLVTEGQTIVAGEKIAEMGRNGRNQALLHFEIRMDGAPVDPLNYLPPR